MEEAEETVKLVVVGDGAIGKTCFLISYTENRFPTQYVPTVFENYTTTIFVEEKIVDLSLWDTAGQEEHKRLRTLSYPCTDIFLLCFSLASRDSLENVKSKWITEIRHHVPHAKIMLVGLKEDLRDQVENGVSTEEALTMASEINVETYMECSALTKQGLGEVFESAVRQVITKPKSVSNALKCVLL